MRTSRSRGFTDALREPKEQSQGSHCASRYEGHGWPSRSSAGSPPQGPSVDPGSDSTTLPANSVLPERVLLRPHLTANRPLGTWVGS